jgi:hypothetical protein
MIELSDRDRDRPQVRHPMSSFRWTEQIDIITTIITFVSYYFYVRVLAFYLCLTRNNEDNGTTCEVSDF